MLEVDLIYRVTLNLVKKTRQIPSRKRFDKSRGSTGFTASCTRLGIAILILLGNYTWYKYL